MIWGIPIVCYLFLAGLGAGAYVTSVLLGHEKPEARKTIRAGRIVAPVVVGVGLILLMVDAEAGLKNPLRFFYLLTNFESVMTWGVVILSVFMAVSLIGVCMDFASKKVPAVLEYVGVAFSLATAAYTGVLLGVVETFPLWNTPILPVLFVVSAFATGLAAVVSAGCLFPEERVAMHGFLVKTRVVLPVVELVLVFVLFATTQGNEAGTATVMSILTGSYAAAFWLVFVGFGLVFPFVVSLMEICQKEDSKGGYALIITSEVGVIFGGFMLRYFVVIAALPIS